MNIKDMITDANARSAKLYLQRQQLQLQSQKVQLASMQVDQELMKLDGEIETLTKMLSLQESENKDKVVPMKEIEKMKEEKNG